MQQALFVFAAEFKADMQKLDAEYQQKANAIKQTYIDGLTSALRTLSKKVDVDPADIAMLTARIVDVQATVFQLAGMV